jgi:hypothetical protein
MSLYYKLQKAADIPLVIPTAVSEDGTKPFGDYVWDVLNTVLINQTKQHQQLQGQHQQLQGQHQQLQQQYQDLIESETFLLAKKIQQSFLMKLWRFITMKTSA